MTFPLLADTDCQYPLNDGRAFVSPSLIDTRKRIDLFTCREHSCHELMSADSHVSTRGQPCTAPPHPLTLTFLLLHLPLCLPTSDQFWVCINQCPLQRTALLTRLGSEPTYELHWSSYTEVKRWSSRIPLAVAGCMWYWEGGEDGRAWSWQPWWSWSSGMRVEEGFFSWWFPQVPAVYRGPTGPVCGSHLSHWSFHGSLSSSLCNILMVLFCLEEFSGSISYGTSQTFLPGNIVHIFVCKTIKSISKTE